MFDDVKRLFVGRPLHSDRMEGTLLPDGDPSVISQIAAAVFGGSSGERRRTADLGHQVSKC